MSGYDNRSRNPLLKSMAHRLTWSEAEVCNEEGDGIAEYAALKGLNQQHRLLITGGGYPQQDRMILDKKRSLDRALKYSYQGAFIKKVDDSAVPWNLASVDNHIPRIRALINPNKLKMDYDDKIISVPKEHGFKPGDIFEWENTNSYWLIYLQDLTELAYFRGDIRRCKYMLKWMDDNGILHQCFAAVRGPVETKINFIQKHQISVDTPNHSLNILMPKSTEAIEYFKRYSKFYLSPSEDGYTDKICYRVEATDWISTPGILEITAVEYYANEHEDDIEGGLVGVHIQEPENPNTDNVEAKIVGETFIKPQVAYVYSYNGLSGNTWNIDTKKYPVTFEPNPKDGREITLTWNSSFSGQFDISIAGVTKTIVVESLF